MSAPPPQRQEAFDGSGVGRGDTPCGWCCAVRHFGAWAAASQYMFAHWIDVGQASVVRKHYPNAGFSEYDLRGFSYRNAESTGVCQRL